MMGISPLDREPDAPVRCYVALGANLGHAAETLNAAVERIDALPATRVTARSSFYGTEPIDSSGPDYTNAVVEIETKLGARDLLHRLQTIENDFGRVRPQGVHNAPRTLDLDVLSYGETISDEAELVLPHPRMHLRAFVLVPLIEICPHASIPGKGPAQAFLSAVADQRIERLVES